MPPIYTAPASPATQQLQQANTQGFLDVFGSALAGSVAAAADSLPSITTALINKAVYGDAQKAHDSYSAISPKVAQQAAVPAPSPASGVGTWLGFGAIAVGGLLVVALLMRR